jgi:hypothetical protein
MGTRSNGITRSLAAAWALLGVTAGLWALAALFLLRVVNIFDRVLMKAPGPYVTFGAMLLCPLYAAWLGRRHVRPCMSSWMRV